MHAQHTNKHSHTHTYCIFIIYTRSEDQSLAKSYIVQLVYQLYPNKMPSTCTHEWMSFSILALSFHKSTYSNWVNAGNMHLYFDSIFCCWFVHFFVLCSLVRTIAHSLSRSFVIRFVSFLGCYDIWLIFLAGEFGWCVVAVSISCHPCLVVCLLALVVFVLLPLVCVVTAVAVLCLFVSCCLFYHILFSLVILYLLRHIFSFAVSFYFFSLVVCYGIFSSIRSFCCCLFLFCWFFFLFFMPRFHPTHAK